MNLSIQIKKFEEDQIDYRAGLLKYWNDNFINQDQFEARFDILATDYAMSVNAYCIVATEAEAVTVMIDATGTTFADQLSGLFT